MAHIGVKNGGGVEGRAVISAASRVELMVADLQREGSTVGRLERF